MGKAAHLATIFFLLLAFLFAYRPQWFTRKDPARPEMQKAIEVSNREVSQLGYVISKMKISVEDDTKQQNKEIDLKEREYWIIYYQPIQLQFGGDVTVFVDKKNYSIIKILRGQ